MSTETLITPPDARDDAANDPRPIFYLCAGPQSSGSTLISWCFLQRQDMDGILDQRGDLLPQVRHTVAQPFAWCKFTISCFRTQEVMTYLEDEGWQVRPLLVVRDVRNILNSLILKSYGRNGTTAEEPPLRLRLRRFKSDWEAASEHGWPTIQYERFITHPEDTLRDACAASRLAWDEGMLTWPKHKSGIFAPIHGNATFRQTCGENLHQTLKPSRDELNVDRIPPADLEWLESEFAEFNLANGYAPHATRHHAWQGTTNRLVPRWENTRRYRRRKRNPISRIVDAITPH